MVLINKRACLEDDILLFASTGTGTVGRMAVIEKYNANWNVSETLYCIKTSEKVLTKYLMYVLYSSNARKQFEPKISKGSVPHLKVADLLEVNIPVPSLEAQERMVKLLDNFDAICSDLNIGLPAEIEARQKQYEFYRDALLTYAATGKIIFTDGRRAGIIRLVQYTFGVVWLKIGDIANVFRGEYITKKDVPGGDIPVILGGQEPAYYISKANHTGEAIVVARSGASAGYVSYWNEPIFVTDGFGYEAKEWLITNKYLYYVMKNMESQLNDMKRGAGVPHISGEAILNIEIPVPPLEKQQEQVKTIERFDMLCNDLFSGLPAEIKARKKQYEYYRDKLLAFKKYQREDMDI